MTIKIKHLLTTLRSDAKEASKAASTALDSGVAEAKSAAQHTIDAFDRVRNTIATNVPNAIETKLERPYVTAHDGFVAYDPSGAIVGGRNPGATLRDFDVPHSGLDPVLGFVTRPESGELSFRLPDGTSVDSHVGGDGTQSVPLGSVKGANVDPSRGGLLDVGVTTPKGHGAQAHVLALPKGYDGPVFVCDLDDTLRPTKLTDALLGHDQKPIDGAQALLERVAKQGIPIVYLSAGTDRMRPLNERFLKQFPPGVLLDRQSVGLRGLDPRNSAQADVQGEYKTHVLNELKHTFPSAQLFGLGDDKYGDATAYTRAGATAYIHDVPGVDNLPADFHGTKTAPYTPAFIEKVTADLKAAVERSASFGGTPVTTSSKDTAARISSELDRVTGTKVIPGNSMQFLIDGEHALPEIEKSLDSAKTSISYETYNFLPGDKVSTELADKLIAASKRGVAVRVVLDAFGAREFPLHTNPTIAKLRAAGVQVQVYNPLDSLSDLNPKRDHRKSIVVDGGTAFVGGMNSAEPWMGGPEVKNRWHDAFAKVQGPAVQEIEKDFRQSWMTAGGASYDLPAKTPAVAGQVPLRIVPHEPGKDRNIEAAYLALIDNAQKSITLENAFPMADAIKDSLIAAAQRGVHVRYIIGANLGVMGDVNESRLQSLLDAGVEVYLYPDRVHTKALSVDGTFATLGSSNTDEVSLKHNREIISVIQDPDAVASLDKSLFERDLVGDSQGHETLRLPKKRSEGFWDRLSDAFLSGVWPGELQ